MNFLPWRKKQEPPQSVFEADPELAKIKLKHQLIEGLGSLPEEDAREVVKYGRKGFHLAKNQPGGKRRKKEAEDATRTV